VVDHALPPGAANLRRDGGGDWLCCTAGCDAKATSSGVVTCRGCGEFAASLVADAEREDGRAGDAGLRELDALRRYADAGVFDVELAAEIDVHRRTQSEAKRAAARIRSRAAQLAEEHTHPVFGCDAHPAEA
jgi:hypothetical protein